MYNCTTNHISGLMYKEQNLCMGVRLPVELATSCIKGLGRDSHDFVKVSKLQLYIW